MNELYLTWSTLKFRKVLIYSEVHVTKCPPQNKITDKCYLCGIAIFFKGSWGVPSSVQCLLLILYSGITPGGAQGAKWGAGNQTGGQMCARQMPYGLYYLSSLWNYMILVGKKQSVCHSVSIFIWRVQRWSSEKRSEHHTENKDGS